MARALIPNSTQIPDAILDHWMAELSGAEFKVLMYVARRTYGFGKDSDTISLNQIANGVIKRDGTVLDRGTGVSRMSVARALKVLEERRVIIRQHNLSEKTREYEENTYRINLDWEPPGNEGPKGGGEGREPTGGGQQEGVVTKCDHLVTGHDEVWSQNVTTVVTKCYPQETDLQETDQETAAAKERAVETDPPKAAADDFLVEELVRHGVGRGTAEALARAKPEVCRQCLKYLPFAKVKTTKGAWLANAIRDEYGPPAGFLKAETPANQQTREGTHKGKAPGKPPPARREAIDSRLKHTYAQLEEIEPRAFAAFLTHLAAERGRAERFAAGLSERRRQEYLASFDTEEHRLRLFARWVVSEGRSIVPKEPPATKPAIAVHSQAVGA
jgi:phage replication O-like protein O